MEGKVRFFSLYWNERKSLTFDFAENCDCKFYFMLVSILLMIQSKLYPCDDTTKGISPFFDKYAEMHFFKLITKC